MNYLKYLYKNNRLLRSMLSVVLAVAVLCSTLSMVALIPASALDIWDGTTVEPTDSDSDGWIEINNGKELAYVIKAGGGADKKYKLTADIYLNDITKINWSTGVAESGYTPNVWYDEWKPNNTDADFVGTIDGDGYVIYGLYLENNPGSYSAYHQGTGLIPRIAEGGSVTITNLGIDNAYFHHANAAAAFVGAMHKNASLTMENCYAGANVTIKGHTAGVLFGYARNNQATTFSATNCYSLATTVAASGGTYGLVGYKNSGTKGTITNCYNGNGPMTVATNPGYFFTATNSYESVSTINLGSNATYDAISGVTTLAAANMQGADVFTNAAKMPNLGDAYKATDTYPTLKVFDKSSAPSCTHEYDDDYDADCNLCGDIRDVPQRPQGPSMPDGAVVWDGSRTAPDDANGDGWYEITNGSELAYVIYNGGGADSKYILTADIYLNDISKIKWATGEKIDAAYTVNSWYDHGRTFQGTIEGNGYVVHGLYNNFAGSSNGLYGSALIPKVTVGGTVTINNLGIENSFVKHHSAAAFICAVDSATVVLDSCYVGANVTLSGVNASAFRSYAKNALGGSITNCYSLATLNANGGQSGLVGLFWDAADSLVMDNCYNAKGPVSTHGGNGQAAATDLYASVAGAFTEGVTVIADAANMQGTDVLTNAEKMPNIGDKFVAGDTYPTLSIFANAGSVQPGGSVTPPPPPACSHEYDDEYDADCNLCGEPREVPDRPVRPTMPSDVTVWDGTTEAPSNGTGTLRDPYLIENGKQLAYVIKTGGAGYFYKLTADIYLNDVSKIDWTNGKADAGYTANEWFDEWGTNKAEDFTGSIDGDGYVIYGLYLENKPDAYTAYMQGTGLIPRLAKNAEVTIKNLGIDCAYFNHANSAAAFIGVAQDGAKLTFNDCYAGANVTVKGASAGIFRAGVKNIVSTSITNCYSLANTVGTVNYGIIAQVYDSKGALTFNNVYNANGPIGFGVDCNIGYYAIATDCYATAVSQNNAGGHTLSAGVTVISADNMKGTDALTNNAKMSGLSKDAYVATEGYPVLTVFTDVEVLTEKPGDVWSGTIAKDYLAGDGSENDPYIISTAYELALAISSNGGGKYYKLTHDIYLNDISDSLWYMKDTVKEWIVNVGFEGHIDGDGHIIYGLYFDKASAHQKAGLITIFKSGSVKNLGIRKSVVNATQYAGGIIGYTEAGIKVIDKCFADETVYINTTLANSGAGGIVGMAFDNDNSETPTLTITNSYSKAQLSGSNEDRLNGILGSAFKTAYSIKNCYSVGAPVYTGKGGGAITSAYWLYVTGDNAQDAVREGKKITDYFSNLYCDVGTPNALHVYTLVADSDSLRGESARTSMPELDYVNVFQTVDGGTPKLKIFTSIDGKDIVSSQDADFFGAGSGTKNDPYIIKTVEHLRYVVEYVDTKGKYYKLANDIYVNDTTKADWMSNNPATWYSHNGTVKFAGHFDGAGYSIFGLYVNETPMKYDGKTNSISHGAGLFPMAVPEASIRNTNIRDSYISGYGSVGGIVGYLRDGNADARLQIVACSVDESVTLHGFATGGLVGVSHARSLELLYCFNTAKITNKGPADKANGFVGDIWGGKVSVYEGYSIGAKILPGNGGTLVNTKKLYGTEDQLSVIILDKNAMTGSAAKNNMDLSWDTVWYTVDGKTPQLKAVAYGDEYVLYEEGSKGKVWSGKVATKFAGGDGTEDSPYLIETPEQLAKIFIDQSDKKLYYKLIADIKLNDTSKDNWENNAKEWFGGTYIFRGVFDGNGHVVSGLYFNKDDNENGKFINAGLFQRIGHGAVIKKVGVINSTIINTSISGWHTYASAICAYIEHWRPDLFPERVAPLISECFADDSVYVEATSAGGIVAGAQTTVRIENCYFTGELTGSVNTGSIVANSWSSTEGPIIKNCYSATMDFNPIGMGNGFASDAMEKGISTFENCYVAGPVSTAGVTPISLMFMKGHDAKNHMQGFNFNTIWKTTANGTPVLRCFANAEKYTCVRDPKKIQISFGNLGDAVVEPIYGYAGYTEITKDMLPVPKRIGYVFNGWHHFNPQGVEFELTVFPNYDITLYANWTEVGFSNNFDGAIDEKYDINEGIEVFKPGIANYDTKYVHSGWRSLHTLANSKVDPRFLMFYDKALEVGREYQITFWMTTDQAEANGKVYFEHSNYADVNAPIIGYEEVATYSLKNAEWKQFTVSVVANAACLNVRVDKGVSVYFEDFVIVPTGAMGEVGNLIGYNPNGVSGEPGAGLAPWLIALIACGGVVILGGGAVGTVLLIRRKK